MKLSAIILSKNEESNIQRSIESVKFADEVIIIDDYSTDNTIKIAEKLGAVVYEHKLEDNFAQQRNFGVEKAKNEWILFIDADEVVTKELTHEITEIVKLDQKDTKAYYIKRRDFFWGREMRFGEVLKVRNKGLMRLIKKDSGKFIDAVHEVFKTNSPTGRLNSFLDHFPHPTVNDFLEDINFYSTLRAKQLIAEGKQGSFFDILLYPPAKFFLNYIFKAGFLDGPAGFVYSFLMSFHSYLVRAKLYQYTMLNSKKRVSS